MRAAPVQLLKKYVLEAAFPAGVPTAEKIVRENSVISSYDDEVAFSVNICDSNCYCDSKRRPLEIEEDRMRIAIIGTGSVGSALGASWAKAGHTIIYGSREPEREDVQTLVRNADGDAAADVPNAAIAAAEAVVLAVPWSAAERTATAVSDWQNKILIDATNPIAPGFKLAVGHNTSGAEEIAGWANGARVVKAFNTTGWNNMVDPIYDGESATMFICGDDAAAKSAVSQLALDLGFDVADVGELAAARWLEPMAMVWISLAGRQGLGRNIAFRLMHR